MEDHVPLAEARSAPAAKGFEENLRQPRSAHHRLALFDLPCMGHSLGRLDEGSRDSREQNVTLGGLGVSFHSAFYQPAAPTNYLYYLTYFYDVDQKNLIIRKGVVTKREMILPFAKITDVSVDQDVMDVMLGIYDVHISTPTVDSGQFAHIDGLNRRGAQEVRQLILDMINQTQYDKQAP